MSQEHPQSTAPESVPLEEVAGDAMASLLQFALRYQKHRFGEAAALATFDQIEGGQARLQAALDIGANHTRVRCTLVPIDPAAQPQVIADMDLLRPQTAH